MFTCVAMAGALYWNVLQDNHMGVSVYGHQEAMIPVAGTAVVQNSRQGDKQYQLVFFTLTGRNFTVYLDQDKNDGLILSRLYALCEDD